MRRGVRTAWWLLLVVACTHFCLAYFQNAKPFLKLNEYIQGASLLPYQYRVLMAWVLRASLRLPGLMAISKNLPPSLREPFFLILFITSWLSLFGSVLFTWGSLTRLTNDQEYSRWASLLVIYMAYFHFPLAFGLDFLLPYDLPSLFFFCGCLNCVISGRMKLFYVFFIFGTLNRETICMAAVFALIWNLHQKAWRSQILAISAHALTQAALWIAIKIYLRHLFKGNAAEVGSASIYYKLGYNIHTFAKPQQWPILLSVFGFTLPLFIALRKYLKNVAMEKQIWMLAAWFTVMMLVGVIIEIRIFSELIGYMALAVGLILYNKFPALQIARTLPINS